MKDDENENLIATLKLIVAATIVMCLIFGLLWVLYKVGVLKEIAEWAYYTELWIDEQVENFKEFLSKIF